MPESETPLLDDIPITLESPWEDFSTPERWRRWLELVMAQGKRGKEHFDYWTSIEGCCERGLCKHLDEGIAYCNLQMLPCCCNPILTIRCGMIGMACMGFGYQPIEEAKK